MEVYDTEEISKDVFVRNSSRGHRRAKLAASLLDRATQTVLGKHAKLITADIESDLVKIYFDHPADVSNQQLRAIEAKANQAIMNGSPTWFASSVGSISITDEGQLESEGLRWISAQVGEAAVQGNQRARETLQQVADALGVKCQDVPDKVTEMAKELKQVQKDRVHLEKIAQALEVGSTEALDRAKVLTAQQARLATLLGTWPGGVLTRAETVVAERDLFQRTCDGLLNELENRE